MNSGQDASPSPPEAEAPDNDTGAGTEVESGVDSDIDPDLDSDVDPDLDTESLRRSRDAIDEGREAAREALGHETDVAGEAES